MNYERRIKECGKGSDVYGVCERCGGWMNNAYKPQFRKVGAINKGWTTLTFAHLNCITRDFPQFKDCEILVQQK